jgi:hypothetical protein
MKPFLASKFEPLYSGLVDANVKCQAFVAALGDASPLLFFLDRMYHGKTWGGTGLIPPSVPISA